MRHKSRLLLLSAVIFAQGVVAQAQNKNAFVGVWEEVGGTNAKGEAETGNAGMRRIFTEGYYSIAFGRQCAGTQVVDKPLQDLTKEQIFDRLRCVIAQDGSFTVDGDKINITRRSAQAPQNVGTKQVMQWKVENGELSLKILSDTGQAPVGQVTRYKRLTSTTKANGAFVGVWEEVRSTNAKGEVGHGNEGMRRIFTADGFYSITFGRQCAGTQVVNIPFQEMTKDQALDRLRCIIAQDGSFTVDGNKLNISRRSDNNPGNVGSKQVMVWKVENGELSLNIIANNNPITVGQTTYYKRLK